MRLLEPGRPDGRRLFRVTWLSSAAAVLVGWLVLLGGWAAADFAPDVGRTCAYAGAVLAGFLALASVVHYPWGPRWCEGLGSKYPGEGDEGHG